MISEKRRPALFAVLATALLLTSGTAGVALATTPASDVQTADGEEVIEEFRTQMDSLDTVQFTRTVESTYDNQTTTHVVDVQADVSDDQKRVETVDGQVNTTRVWDDGTVVMYNADENTVSEYEVMGASLLPRLQSFANETVIDYEYAGTETVDGQETHVLEAERNLSAQTESDAEATATLYIDTETYFPVQVQSQVSGEQFEHSSTVSYENVTLGEEIPASTFELDLPDDVEDLRENTLPDISRYDSHETLDSRTELSVPTAELPGEFSFERGIVFEDDQFRSVTLTYTDGEESISVVTRADPITSFEHSESDLYEAVEVGDTTGYLYSTDGFVSLYVEADQPYTIHGEVDDETVTEIAQALLAE